MNDYTVASVNSLASPNKNNESQTDPKAEAVSHECLTLHSQTSALDSLNDKEKWLVVHGINESFLYIKYMTAFSTVFIGSW